MKINTSKKILFCVLFCLFITDAYTQEDIIYLKSGEKLTGTITILSSTKISISKSKFELAEVDSFVASDERFENLQLKNGKNVFAKQVIGGPFSLYNTLNNEEYIFKIRDSLGHSLSTEKGLSLLRKYVYSTQDIELIRLFRTKAIELNELNLEK